jgi:hypothetical protein
MKKAEFADFWKLPTGNELLPEVAVPHAVQVCVSQYRQIAQTDSP